MSFRLNVPLQILGWFLTAGKAAGTWIVLYILMRVTGPHNFETWLAFAGSAALTFVCWVLYTVLDIDGDGADG